MKSNTTSYKSWFGLGLTLLTLCTLMPSAAAQNKEGWGDTNSIEDVKVEIIREKQITLPEVSRNFEKMPPHAPDSVRPKLSYRFQPVPFSLPTYSFSINPMRLKSEPISKIYNSSLSVGFGNYLSPYLNVWFNTKRSEKRFYGASVYHRSSLIGPVDEENSATFDSHVKLFGALYGKKITFDAQVEYNNEIGYFYGYAPDQQVSRNTIEQVYHIASVRTSLTKTHLGRFNFSAHANTSYLADRYNASEIEFGAKFRGRYKTGKKTEASFFTDYALMRREDTGIPGALRHLLKLEPAFTFSPFKNMTIKAGINAIINHEADTSQFFRIYPNVHVQYQMLTHLSAYAMVSGDVDKVSLHTLAAENFWVNDNLTIRNTNRSYEVQIGLQGKVGRRFNWEAGFARVNLEPLYMYINSPTDRAKFDVVYSDVDRVHLFAKAGYRKGKKIVVDLQGDYFNYSARNDAPIWHKPTYRISFHSSFDIYKKIVVNLDFIGQGGMYGPNPDANNANAIELDPALDLNLKISYFISKPFSVFVNLENILANSYPIYQYYRVRGIQVMGGISWSF